MEEAKTSNKQGMSMKAVVDKLRGLGARLFSSTPQEQPVSPAEFDKAMLFARRRIERHAQRHRAKARKAERLRVRLAHWKGRG